MRNKLKNISIFKKLISLFVLILLPMLTLGTISVQIANRNLTTQIKNSMQSQMVNYTTALENEFRRINSLSVDLFQDKDVLMLAKSPEAFESKYDEYSAILRVYERINLIKSSSPYVSNVRIFIPSLGWSINSKGFSLGSYTSIDRNEMKKISKKAYTQMNANTQNKKSIVSFENNKIIMLTGYLGSSTSDMTFVINIEFSKDELYKYLENNIEISNSKFMFVSNESNFSLGNLNLNELENLSEFSNFSNVKINGINQTIILTPSNYFNANYYKIIPNKNLMYPMQVLSFITILFFSYVILCIFVYFIVTRRMINKPLLNLVQAFEKVELGDFSFELSENGNSEFFYLFHSFNNMNAKLKIMIDEVYNQKILLQKSEYKQLQTQINPHFLYNSYFLLHRLIKKEDYYKAVKFSKEMGTYFRYITRNGSDTLAFGLENDHAKTYTAIQAMRFEGRIKVIYHEFPEEFVHYLVPRLIMQPILENAFEYGLENKQENGVIVVRFECGENCISVFCEDNGDEIDENAIEELNKKIINNSNSFEITGLENINRRLKIKFGDESGLFMTKSKLGGLCVELRIIFGKCKQL